MLPSVELYNAASASRCSAQAALTPTVSAELVGVGQGVEVGRGFAVAIGQDVEVGRGFAVGVGVAVGVWVGAAMVAAMRASTVASRSGVGGSVGVGVGVGAAAWVASIPAETVAPMSWGGVGVSVGSALATAARTVAPKSAVAAGTGDWTSGAQARAISNATPGVNMVRPLTACIARILIQGGENETPSFHNFHHRPYYRIKPKPR